MQSNSSGRTMQRNVAHLKPLPVPDDIIANDGFKEQLEEHHRTDDSNRTSGNGIEESQSSIRHDEQSSNRSMRMVRKPAYLKDYQTNAVYDAKSNGGMSGPDAPFCKMTTELVTRVKNCH